MRLNPRRLWQHVGGIRIPVLKEVIFKLKNLKNESELTSASETLNILTKLLIFPNSPLTSQGISASLGPQKSPFWHRQCSVSMLCSQKVLSIVPHFPFKLTDSCLALLTELRQPMKSSPVALFNEYLEVLEKRFGSQSEARPFSHSVGGCGPAVPPAGCFSESPPSVMNTWERGPNSYLLCLMKNLSSS